MQQGLSETKNNRIKTGGIQISLANSKAKLIEKPHH